MKVVGIFLLVVVGLLALLVAACGGMFSLMALGSSPRWPAYDLLIFSLPSLAVGIAGLIACVRGVRKLAAPVPEEPSLQEKQE